MSGLFLEENTVLLKALGVGEASSSSTCSERTQERARIRASGLTSSRPVLNVITSGPQRPPFIQIF